MRVRFGPSGLPGNGGLKERLEALKEMGFDACELDFVREFWVDKEDASGARGTISELGVAVRAHAPFYGVLSQGDPEKEVMAVAMMHHTANLVHLMGGDGITVHPGFYMGRSRKEVMSTVEARCGELQERLESNDIDDVIIGVENMGNGSEFGGNLEDILDICEISPIIFPLIDWGHIQATCDGCLVDANSYVEILASIEDRLDVECLRKTRHQFSEVEYSDRKERRHLAYGSGDLKLDHLLQALEEMGLKEVLIISESPGYEDHRKMLELVRSETD